MNKIETTTNTLCWKTPGHEMRVWAEECDTLTPNELGRHGMGDLDKPCLLVPGEPCQACGKEVL